MNIVRRRSAFSGIARYYSSTPPTKPSISLIAELRKQTQLPLSKIREALAQSNNSIPDALSWLEKDMVASGQSKLDKVGSRSTTQGVIAISVLSEGGGFKRGGGVRAGMVELNCETDFVERNELFAKLASDIAHTVAFISEAKNNSTNGDQQVEFNPLSVDQLKDAPLLVNFPTGVRYDKTVQAAIRDTIVKVGENISLRRATSIVEDAPLDPPTTTTLRISSYIHGSLQNSPLCGQIGALVLLSLRSPQLSRLRTSRRFRENLYKLERSLARQVVAFPSLIPPTPENKEGLEGLYKQQFITFPGELSNNIVKEALKKWSITEGVINPDQDESSWSGIDVLRFAHWKVGDEL